MHTFVGSWVAPSSYSVTDLSGPSVFLALFSALLIIKLAEHGSVTYSFVRFFGCLDDVVR